MMQKAWIIISKKIRGATAAASRRTLQFYTNLSSLKEPAAQARARGNSDVMEGGQGIFSVVARLVE